jgi:hypothetical protein
MKTIYLINDEGLQRESNWEGSGEGQLVFFLRATKCKQK